MRPKARLSVTGRSCLDPYSALPTSPSARTTCRPLAGTVWSTARTKTSSVGPLAPGRGRPSSSPRPRSCGGPTVDDDSVSATTPDLEMAPLAVVGARPCELVALGILDRVLVDGAHPDPRYAARRVGAFVVAAECGSPAATCFCTSMGSGPGAESGFDLALTELNDDEGHRFVVRIGSERGADVLAGVPVTEPTAADLAARDRVLDFGRGHHRPPA